jgi:hypothetical protein
LVAILVVGPTTGVLASIDTANLRAYQFLTIFQAYGGLLALLAPLAALRIVDDARRLAGPEKRFEVEHSVLLLVTAAFAGYLSLWVHEPIGVPILIAVGWIVFFYGVIGLPPKMEAAAKEGLAQRILAFRAETRLLEARQKTYEKKFTEGEIDAATLAKYRAEIKEKTDKANNTLVKPVEEAKRILLGFGPGESPLRNGLIGAGTGLMVVALLQIVLPIDFTPSSTEHAPAWLNILQTFIVDPNYRPAMNVADVSRLLALISELLNATAIWVFFGFCFWIFFSPHPWRRWIRQGDCVWRWDWCDFPG